MAVEDLATDCAWPKSLSDSQEAEQLLTIALPKVLEFIRRGEDPDCQVTKWPTAEQARAGVRLHALSAAAESESNQGKTNGALNDTLNGHSEKVQKGKAKGKQVDGHGVTNQALFETVDAILENSVNPWTGRFLDKLYSAPHPIGLLADLLLSALNANCHVMSASPVLTLAEEACVREIARLCGWISKAGSSGSGSSQADLIDGLTMPGGSAANTLALQTALQARFPLYKEDGCLGILEGLASDSESKGQTPEYRGVAVLTSSQGHYSIEKACVAAGLGTSSCIEVPCDRYGRMDPEKLEATLQSLTEPSNASQRVRRLPVFVNATAGTTVLGSFDNLRAIAAVAKRHGCWMHVDGSWGGPVLFSRTHRDLMDGIELADSFTINPHKALNVPLQCSFLILREGKKWFGAGGKGAQYLFHSSNVSNNAGMKTLGCGRRGDALKFYLSWLRYGRGGFGDHIDKGIALAERVASMVKAHGDKLQLHLGPDRQFMQVCFRPSSPHLSQGPPCLNVNIELLSKAAVEVRNRLQDEKMFAVDFAPLPEGVGQFIRLVVHPRAKESDLRVLVDRVALLGQDYFAALLKEK